MPESKDQQLAISRSTSFRRFQGRIGSATYRLNTIFVGLEHIGAGKGKLSGGIAVRWEAPKSSEIAKQVADQARQFACLAATALAFDVIDQYLDDISREPWINLPDDVRSVATKAKTRASDQGGAYGLHERALAVANELGLHEPLHIALLELLAKWRNSSVHGSSRDGKLSDESRVSLQDEAAIYEAYSHLDIKLAIANFTSKKTPVPKEITSLIASAQNLFRKIDEAAIKRAFPTSKSLENYCSSIFHNSFISDSGTLTTKLNEYFSRPQDWRKNFLLKTISPAGVTYTQRPVSAVVNGEFFDHLARLDHQSFLKALSPPFC